SDKYVGAQWRIAFAVALILDALIVWVINESWFIAQPEPLLVLILLVPLLLPGFLLARISFIKKVALSNEEVREEVYQRAIQAFFAHGLHETKDRCGILIFASVLEKRVEILADAGINERLPKDTWDNIISSMTTEMGQGHVADAFSNAIKECGILLAREFPIKGDDVNELDDNLVIE
ncbi:MAG: TPM domain-containing protein, partial [Candidatus Lindowbacteria bacterium]|nr:TPM domain-containing protein [Candidatus Lindowbacteria bacterium]